ncbi:Plant self-incompatibility S1 - like 8 [Theobroma cacao]|nr:Plant self-incompatibility S1 - like 8 [Theobroma cacao]
MANLKELFLPMLAFCILYPLAFAIDEDLLVIEYHIHIINDLPSDLPPNIPALSLHCKSKDKDLDGKGSRGILRLSRLRETNTAADCIITLACGLLQHKVHVQITNDIAKGSDLTVRCKSKNDDLGNQVISYQGTWEFHFRPNVWGTTQFYCSMAWEDQFHWFDIFVANRDYSYCHVCQ